MTTTTAAPATEKKPRVKHSLAERLASMKAETFKEFKEFKKAHEEEGAAITTEVARRKMEAESL